MAPVKSSKEIVAYSIINTKMQIVCVHMKLILSNSKSQQFERYSHKDISKDLIGNIINSKLESQYQ